MNNGLVLYHVEVANFLQTTNAADCDLQHHQREANSGQNLVVYDLLDRALRFLVVEIVRECNETLLQ